MQQSDCRCVLAAAGKSGFGLYGVVGGMPIDGMTMIELLANTMRSVRGGIVAREMRGERSGECDYIRTV